MNKIILIFSFIILTITSCNQEDVDSEDLIKENEFISLMVQIQLMESYCQDNFVRPDHYKDLLHRSVDSLLEARGYTIEEYEISFDYYSKKPDKMFFIYEAVLDSLNQMQVEISAIPQKD